MKTILVYGDSNTWGQTGWPFNGEPRLAYNQRWTGQIARQLGDEAKIIEEGLGGRTAGDIQEGDTKYRNGQVYFKAAFRSHEPIDVLVVALGTNDCQVRYSRTAEQIYEDLSFYQQEAGELHLKEYKMPKVVFVLPPPFNAEPDNAYFLNREHVRNELARLMTVSKDMDVIDAGEVSLASDGVHFSAEGHKQMADAVVNKLKEIGYEI